jgi:hypothetical protein
MDALRSFFGLLVLILIAWAFSTDRRRICWRTVAWGTGLQLVFALLILKTQPGEAFFDFCGRARSTACWPSSTRVRSSSSTRWPSRPASPAAPASISPSRCSPPSSSFPR